MEIKIRKDRKNFKNLSSIKMEVVRKVLAYFKGNKTNTAKALDISIRGLQKMIRRNEDK